MSDPAPYFVHPTPTNMPAFFVQPYTAGSNPNPGLYPNQMYMDTTSHPSDLTVHADYTTRLVDDAVKMDSVFPIGSTTSGYSKTSMMSPTGNEFLKIGSFGDGGGHAFGYASCQWLRACTSSEMVGSPCSQVLSGVFYQGYCFKSDTGSLECGRLAALDDEYGEKPIIFDNYNGVVAPAGRVRANTAANPWPVIEATPGSGTRVNSTGLLGVAKYRCPMGSPAKTLGTFVSKRPLIAGCMITSDPNFDVVADVHVPAYCATPADFKVGCLLPAASNFDPSAKQSGPCKFKSSGCTDPTAVNYNSFASDDDGSCIAKVVGCTVNEQTYTSLGQPAESDTPTYKSLEAAVNVRWAGVRKEDSVRAGDNTVWYTSKAVTNYDPNANVLGSCTVAIEGCMNSNAANYNPHATTNTGTWCVPVLKGCMLPAWNGAGPSWTGSGKEGLAITFQIEATVHDKASCVNNVAHYGCADSNAMNYDPATTAPSDAYPCYYFKEGCLNPRARNYGCTDFGTQPCSLDVIATRVTAHNPLKCSWVGGLEAGAPNPPMPPPPALPVNGGFVRKQTDVAEVKVSLAGTPESLTTTIAPNGKSIAENVVDSVAAKLAPDKECKDIAGDACNGVGADCITVRAFDSPTCTTRRKLSFSAPNGRQLQAADTTQMKVSIRSDNANDAADLVSSIQSVDLSAESIEQAIFENAGITVEVTSAAEASAVTIETFVPEGDDDNVGVIIGVIIGVLFGLGLLFGAYKMYMKKKGATTVVPA